MFCHIPRTAGRYVTEVLYRNGYVAETHQKVNKTNWKFGSAVMHLGYDEITELYGDWDYLPKPEVNFSICRHPVTKFASVLDYFFSALRNGNYNKEINYENFVEIMDEENFVSKWDGEADYTVHFKGLRYNPSRFWTPQYEFINDDTKVWKFEDGFGYDFYDWLNEIGIEVERKVLKKEVYTIDPTLDLSSKKYNIYDYENLASYIERYYEKDIELFGY